MTTAQNQNSVRPRPATKNPVLPQVRYHPSIQNPANPKPQRPDKTQTEQNTHTRRSPPSSGSGSGLDCAKTVALKGTRQGSETVTTDVSGGPSPLLARANRVPSPKGSRAKKNLVLPQVWYHPSIKNSGNSSMEKCELQKMSTGEEPERVQATGAGDAGALCPEDLGASAEGGARNGTRHDSKAAKSSDFKVLPQVQYQPSTGDCQGSARNGPPEKTLEMETPQCTDGTRKPDLETSKASGSGPEEGDGRGDGCTHGPGGTSRDGSTPDETRRGTRRRRRRRGGGQNSDGTDGSEGSVPLKDETREEGSNSGAAVCNGGDFTVVSDGRPQKAMRRKTKRSGEGESHGTDCEILPTDETRVESLKLRSSAIGGTDSDVPAEGPPQETTRRKARNTRTTVGNDDGKESHGTSCEIAPKDDGTGEAKLENPNSGSSVVKSGASSLDSDGTKCGRRTPKATSKSARNTGSGVGEGELHGTDCETLPKDEPPNGTRLENYNSRSAAAAAEGLPQEATRSKARNTRPGVGDGLKPITSPPASVSAEGPEGPAGLQGPDSLMDLRPGSSLDQSVVEKVEALTRGQRTNPNWFQYRKNRITASVAHSIARCGFVNGKSSAPPASYVRTITGEGPRVQTRAMTWGIDHEKEAVQKYQEQQSAALGRPVSVLDCGLFIDRSRPWLAASPDGIVTDTGTGRQLRCLEVKCPYKHRDRTLEWACREDKDFCLEITDQQGAQQTPVFSLKRSHPYFTQVQCQMAVTGLKMADFVVFTLRDLAVVPVRFDPDFWDQTVTKLERFYSEAVVPVLRGRGPERDREL